jgi:hypothetical protein
MSGRDIDKWRPDFSPDDQEPAADEDAEAGEDVLDQGGHGRPVRWWRPPRVAVVLGGAGLIVGLAAGYVAGAAHTRSGPVPAPSPAAAPNSIVVGPAPAVAQVLPAGTLCSSSKGTNLQPGLRVTYPAPAPGTLPCFLFPPGTRIEILPSQAP